MQNLYIRASRHVPIIALKAWPTAKTNRSPSRRGGGTARECGNPLAADQRYCLNCGARRGLLPGAVAGRSPRSRREGQEHRRGRDRQAPKPEGGDDEGGWSWMPSPQAIAIAVIGMLALGVGLGSAMSEIASSAPLSTILLEYPHHAAEGPPPEPNRKKKTAEEEPDAPRPEEAAPKKLRRAAGRSPSRKRRRKKRPKAAGRSEEETALQKSIERRTKKPKKTERKTEEALPEVKHAWLIVLGENSYESTFGAAAERPTCRGCCRKRASCCPNYYGVTAASSPTRSRC